LRGCNGAAVALQRSRRCTMTAAPLQTKEALTAEQIRTFWPQKAIFRRSEIAQIWQNPRNIQIFNSLCLHAQIFDICVLWENIFGGGHS
ncbi:MAG: hypothetical protein K2L56_05625, partial [Prevotella sp.]|nr:hypothetical protein [Prevotella sp.]